jgi:hypothetical protein
MCLIELERGCREYQAEQDCIKPRRAGSLVVNVIERLNLMI